MAIQSIYIYLMEVNNKFLELRRRILRSKSVLQDLLAVWTRENQLARSIFRTFNFSKRRLIVLEINSTYKSSGFLESKRYLSKKLLKQLIMLHKIEFYNNEFGINIPYVQRPLFDRTSLFLTALSVFITFALAFSIVSTLNSDIHVPGVPIDISNDIFSNITYGSGFSIKQENNKTHSNFTGTYNNTNSTVFSSALSSIVLIFFLCLAFCLYNLAQIVKQYCQSQSFQKDCLKLQNYEMLAKYRTVLPPLIVAEEIIEEEHWQGRLQHHPPSSQNQFQQGSQSAQDKQQEEKKQVEVKKEEEKGEEGEEGQKKEKIEKTEQKIDSHQNSKNKLKHQVGKNKGKRKR